MNVLAIYVVNEYLQSMNERSMQRRYTVSSTGPSLRDRIASAAAGLRRLVGSPAASAGPLPRLEDYPYRG